MQKIYEYKNSTAFMLQKNIRRLNAYIRQSKIKRIKVIIMLLCLIVSSFKITYAIENDNIYYGEYKIQCFKDPYMYIKYNGVMQANNEYYYIKDNVEYPVYCLNLGLKGAEDNMDGYVVDGSEEINDDKLKLIILNSYPYKTVEELGLNNIHEAKFASQFAIWCYLENLDLNLIEPISDMNIKLVETIKEIYNSINDDINDKNINLEFKEGLQNFEIIDNTNYYIKELEIVNKKNIIDYSITTKDKNIKVIKNTENKYKICVPVDIVDKSYSVELNVDLNAKENVVLFGKTTVDGYQNVAITLKDSFNYSFKKKIDFEDYETNIKIIKKDKDTNSTLEGVKYKITDINDKFIGEYVTDSAGEINVKLFNIDDLQIKIKEVLSKNNYKLDENIYEYNIKPNSNLNIELYNEKKKGYIEIIKKTKSYNELTNLPENYPLKNVCFDILDSELKVVDSLRTDENGYAISKKLPVGKYYIKETKTNEYYKINSELLEVEILNDEDKVNVQILNDNVYIEKKLPVTGK